MQRQWKALLVGLVSLAALGVGVVVGRVTAPRVAPAPIAVADGVTQQVGQAEVKAGEPKAPVAEGMMGPVASPEARAAAEVPWAVGTCPGGYGPGMMGWGAGMMEPGGVGGMMGNGMAPGYGMMGEPPAAPLTVDEARAAVEDFLRRWGDENLGIREIMVFDNHAYAQIVEQDTGIGAMEVLVDPVTKAVYPEHGPNMMWNTKYSPMQAGWQGMMMTWWAGGTPTPPSLDEATAVAQAQQFLETAFPGQGYQAAEPVPFYGYYTLHILKDGEPVGMLSVHGESGAVFLHFWHGRLVAMEEAGE